LWALKTPKKDGINRIGNENKLTGTCCRKRKATALLQNLPDYNQANSKDEITICYNPSAGGVGH